MEEPGGDSPADTDNQQINPTFTSASTLGNFMTHTLTFPFSPGHQQLNTDPKQEQGSTIKLSKKPQVHTEDRKLYEDGRRPVRLSGFTQVQPPLCSVQQHILKKA